MQAQGALKDATKMHWNLHGDLEWTCRETSIDFKQAFASNLANSVEEWNITPLRCIYAICDVFIMI